MKQLLITTIAAVLLVGCGETQQTPPSQASKPVEAIAEAAAKPKPLTVHKTHRIHLAVKTGTIKSVKKHLDAGVDVNVKDAGGQTPLHWAVEEGHKEIAELLITKGADVNANNYGEWTPLHTAADIGHKEIIELLIAKGADVNAKITSGPIQGYTPLYLAIINNKTETASLLRKHGGKTGEELEAEGK